MSDNAAGFDFTKFIPGFDFLQQMTQPNAATPAVSQWIAPTIDPDEIGKRIQELKTVQFWLEQNATALKATIQALEVQQLTCSTLKNMNAQMNDVAAGMQAAMQTPKDTDTEATDAAPDTSAFDTAMEQTTQWWGGLLQTFQDIAEQAQSEVQQRQEEFMEATTSKSAKKATATRRKTASTKTKTSAAKATSSKKTSAKASSRTSKAATRSRTKKS